MTSIIKIKSASYVRYEELLNKKLELKKQAFNYKNEYQKIFGRLNDDAYSAKLECVKRKKTITYCQNIIDLDDKIRRKELNNYIKEAMEDYKKTMEIFKDDDENKIYEVTPAISKKIKDIYHRLAKQIHPDMNADLKQDKTILDLWNRVNIAYNCSNYEEIQEIDVLVNNYLESIYHSHIDVEIPNVDEKIFNLNEQIEHILNTNPYQYKYLLADKMAIKRKKEELKKQIQDYKRYKKELDKKIAQFDII